MTVYAPATSANLGAGFDAIGVAVGIGARITVAIGTGEEGDRSPVGRMTRAAFRAAWSAGAGDAEAPSPIEIGGRYGYPVGGAVWAPARRRGRRDLGGQPDAGVAAVGCGAAGAGDAAGGSRRQRGAGAVRRLSGGGGRGGNGWSGWRCRWQTGCGLSGSCRVFRCQPRRVRELLPSELSRADAVHQSSRSTLLAAALTTGSWGALRTATDDRLHQPPAQHPVSVVVPLH